MKGGLVKQIQLAGKSAHGQNIKISRLVTLITKATKWNKREWGKLVLTLMMKAQNSGFDSDMTNDSDTSLATTISCDVDSPKHMVLTGQPSTGRKFAPGIQVSNVIKGYDLSTEYEDALTSPMNSTYFW